MKSKWNLEWLKLQEDETDQHSSAYYSRQVKGFYHLATEGVELMIQGVGYLKEPDGLDANREYPNFKVAIRHTSAYHYHTIPYTFKAAFDLWRFGYYTESSILLRTVVEKYVKLRYLNKQKSVDLIKLSSAGHLGINGEKFSQKHKYRTMFDVVAPKLYKDYQYLCELSHGTNIPYLLKTNFLDIGIDAINSLHIDTGVSFNEKLSQMIVNPYCIYMLSHLEFMVRIFPEIKINMETEFSTKLHNTLDWLWKGVQEDPKFTKEQNEWRRGAIQLAKIDDD